MNGARLTGRQVLLAVLGFFAVVLVANGVFVYLAVDSWPGLDTENAYRRGLAYNRELEAASAQAALGWRVSLEVRDAGARSVLVEVRIRDAAGAGVDGLDVSARLRRPTHEGLDTELALAGTGGGGYSDRAAVNGAGNWDLRVVAREAGEVRYVVDDRIWVQ
jgi:nitrogen fixation protein FixH